MQGWTAYAKVFGKEIASMILKARPAPAIAALVATLAIGTSPAAAAPLRLSPAAMVQAADDHLLLGHSRRYRDHDSGIDTGDVIAGILAVGAIAVLVGAAAGDRDRGRRVPQQARVPGSAQPEGIGRAVDMCVAEVERSGARVVEIGGASRDASGWLVTGDLAEGEGFSCRIGNDGRIDRIDYGARSGSSIVAGDRQYDAAVYARLRAGQRANGVTPAAVGQAQGRSADGTYSGTGYPNPGGAEDYPDPRPAYPGGPLPGEQGYEDHAGGYDPVSYTIGS